MNVPNGLTEIVSTFGDIHKYIDDTGVLSSAWTRDYLGIAQLPFAIPLSWNKDVSVQRMTCHKLMMPIFEDVFGKIKDQGISDLVKTFGGCFSFRPQRTGHKLSTHAWAISIDLNPEDNEQGTAGNMPQPIIDVFTGAGFEWGGSWAGKVRDPMHMQFAENY